MQSMPVMQSGAGKRLVEWDVDDAVFMETGKDFLRDAVELLKGVRATSCPSALQS